jgi:DNA-binding transcriptional regulator LsrR (DeoR family)
MPKKVSWELTTKNMSKNMENIHSEKIERNQQIRKLLASGKTQADIARKFRITGQRLNQLVQKWVWQGLLERTEDGFAVPPKGRAPEKVIHNQSKL